VWRVQGRRLQSVWGLQEHQLQRMVGPQGPPGRHRRRVAGRRQLQWQQRPQPLTSMHPVQQRTAGCPGEREQEARGVPGGLWKHGRREQGRDRPLSDPPPSTLGWILTATMACTECTAGARLTPLCTERAARRHTTLSTEWAAQGLTPLSTEWAAQGLTPQSTEQSARGLTPLTTPLQVCLSPAATHSTERSVQGRGGRCQATGAAAGHFPLFPARDFSDPFSSSGEAPKEWGSDPESGCLHSPDCVMLSGNPGYTSRGRRSPGVEGNGTGLEGGAGGAESRRRGEKLPHWGAAVGKENARGISGEPSRACAYRRCALQVVVSDGASEVQCGIHSQI